MITGTYTNTNTDTDTDLDISNTFVPTRDDEAIEMYINHIRVADICVELGIYPTELYIILRKNGVPINRKGAHPTGTSQVGSDSDANTLSPPFGVTSPRAIGRPPHMITKELYQLILSEFKSCGSARQVALENDMSYWTVLKILHSEGIHLTIGNKKRKNNRFFTLAGRLLTSEEVLAMRLEVEKVYIAATATDAPSFNDLALDYGVSVGTFMNIVSRGTGAAAEAVRITKRGAVEATSTVSIADTITAITNEVEARVRRGLDSELQPTLFDV